LKTLPDSIGELELLQELDLSENLISILPESIGNLNSLKIILLGANKLTRLPKSFSNLINLDDAILTLNDWQGEWKEMSNKWHGNEIPTLLRLCVKLNGLNIFISHAVKDQDVYQVIDLRNQLENKDIIREVYVCEEDLVDSIRAFMAENIPKSHLLIFIATKNSLNSIDCQYELALARKYGVSIWLLKGIDISWKELNQIDLRFHNQGFMDIANLTGFNYDTKNFNRFCEKLFENIRDHEAELKLLKSKSYEFENTLEEIQKNIFKFIDSIEFRTTLRENLGVFEDIFQEVSDNKIDPLQYFSKTGKIIAKKD
jgi:hypothetical protein